MFTTNSILAVQVSENIQTCLQDKCEEQATHN